MIHCKSSKLLRRECPICNRQYEADPKRLKHGRQTTCSRKCSYLLRTKNLTKRKLKCCPCGNEFEGLEANKYCSTRCLYKFRKNSVIRKDKGIQRVFHSYSCELCNKEFHPRNRRTKGRIFCSRKCYEKQKSSDMSGSNNPMFGKSPTFKPSSWRQGWHVIGGNRYYFRSSWEVAVAIHLENEGYDWKYEFERYKLRDDLTYVPDFFIMNGNDIGRIIEVKGWLKPKDELKIKLFRQQHHIPLEVWGRKKMNRLKLLDGNGYGKFN